MSIRRAALQDLEGINRLLRQVLDVHHEGRPDLFKANAKKYTDEELAVLLRDEERPVFLFEDEAGEILGYAFCVFQRHEGENILCDGTTLYIDDLCVDECARGKRVGRRLYEHVLNFAKESGCYNVTLNVWACNPGALAFYRKCGLEIQKYGMEKIL